jgi:prepilin-type N-terminal cleavage/methylation domain-containing protein
MKILNNNQSGFTLVELVVVVAVIGVLAVIAAPKIVGVASDAREASLTAVTSSMTASMARNYAAREASSTAGVSVQWCGDITKLIDGNTLPSGYMLDGNASSAVDKNISTACVLTTTGNEITRDFFAIGVSVLP